MGSLYGTSVFRFPFRDAEINLDSLSGIDSRIARETANYRSHGEHPGMGNVHLGEQVRSKSREGLDDGRKKEGCRSLAHGGEAAHRLSRRTNFPKVLGEPS